MRYFHAIAFLFLGYLYAGASAQEATSTDEALIEDLGAELLDPSEDAGQSVLDERLTQQLGEDVGETEQGTGAWISKVIAPMKTAERILGRSDPSMRASESQSEALTGLDAMIAELTQRKSECKGGSCPRPGESKPGKKAKPGGKPGKSSAQSSSSSANDDAKLSTNLAIAEDLVKDLWGKLPERQRQQILQPLSEEFLPKYAEEIEAYFRALAQPKDNATEPR